MSQRYEAWKLGKTKAVIYDTAEKGHRFPIVAICQDIEMARELAECLNCDALKMISDLQMEISSLDWSFRREQEA